MSVRISRIMAEVSARVEKRVVVVVVEDGAELWKSWSVVGAKALLVSPTRASVSSALATSVDGFTMVTLSQ